MVDILAVYTTRLHFKWVSKIENFYAPFLGWTMILNRDVPLRRYHLPSILRMVRTCNTRLHEGSSLCIFPEGTRSEDGNLRSFYRGAFFLSVKNRVPIVPIVLDGTHEILPKGRATVSPRRVRVRILDPIDPASANWDSRRLRDRVRAKMMEELAKMRAGRVME
jgi:1-acyl-sn-glycerol-3-phosphate acyltransferase